MESFTKCIRWKALEFLGKLGSNEKETSAFKSHNCPPSVNELAEFESYLLIMVDNIEFRLVKNNLLSKLKDDVKILKSTNTYKMNKNANLAFPEFRTMGEKTWK